MPPKAKDYGCDEACDRLIDRTGPEPSALSPERREPSGIHRKLVAPVAAPANREELLEKLRERARARAQTSAPHDSERAG